MVRGGHAVTFVIDRRALHAEIAAASRLRGGPRAGQPLKVSRRLAVTLTAARTDSPPEIKNL